MGKKIVYFSLSIGVKKIKKLSEFTAISDLKYLMALNNEFDLHIIHPEEYDFQRRTVRASYSLKIDNDNISFPQKKGTHEPKGDSFLVYSDGSRRNPGLKYMLEQNF